jgi:putative hemolysin
MIGVVLAASLLLAACGSGVAAAAAPLDSAPAVEEVPAEEPAELVALPFHDVVDYCVELGYEMKVVHDENNCVDYQYCVFPDGSECKADDILRGICGKAQTFCEQQGYEIGMRDGLLTCLFDDGSYCKEMNYLFGECEPGDNYE